MAAPIDKIRLKNFKAFYGDEDIDLEGKHLLLYGENGSGKSSIYWSLYTMLQSATKDRIQIEKYFIPNNDEHLINHDFLKEHPSFAVDADGKITDPVSIGVNASVKIELTDGNSSTINSTGKTDATNILEDLNQYSDFISHRLLINFYNFRNSKQINLWEVFVRDIFPFLLTAAGDETLGQVFKEIETKKPFYNFTGDTFKLRTKKSQIRKDYLDRIKLLNDNLDRWIADINGLVDAFYNTHFREVNEPQLRIVLDYNVKLVFDDIFQEQDFGNNTHYMWSKKHVNLNDPFIKLNISQQDQNGNWVLIEKPQSYFNEAKLTQIALSVRFSLLDDSIRPEFEGQFLALDDLLVSLDMANRDKVLNIILNEFAPRFRIYLFTHERAFFNMIKERIFHEHNIDDWKLKELYTPKQDEKKPQILETGTNLSKANERYISNDYPAAINYLRKELENILEVNLPSKIQKSDKGEDLKTLDSLIESGVLFIERFGLNSLPLKRTKQYLKILLNPLSHNSNDTEIYETDIVGILKILRELRLFLTDFKNNISEIHPRESEFIMAFEESASITQEYCILLKEDLYSYINGGQTEYSNCIIHSTESRTIENGTATEWTPNAHYKVNSLNEFYVAVCEFKIIEPLPEYIPLFRTKNEGNAII
jgi:ABC-type dipeptide/oligopeptide/nickel transport system ATPase subunit